MVIAEREGGQLEGENPIKDDNVGPKITVTIFNCIISLSLSLSSHVSLNRIFILSLTFSFHSTFDLERASFVEWTNPPGKQSYSLHPVTEPINSTPNPGRSFHILSSLPPFWVLSEDIVFPLHSPVFEPNPSILLSPSV